MRARHVPAAVLFAVGPLLIAAGCSKEEAPTMDDSTPPAAVTDLVVSSADQTTVTLSWTASGDDDTRGTASSYDLRYAAARITNTTWIASISASGEPIPKEAGEPESYTVTGLDPGAPYSFALRVLDESMNLSGLSNVVSTTTIPNSGDSKWWDGFHDQGVNGPVYALAVYDESLVAGGSFTEAGGLPTARIARFDGLTWSPLGDGMDSEVWALVDHNGDLIAGGAFSHAGSAGVHYIARWDGSDWSPLGSGMNNLVLALVAWQGDLVAGGLFTRAGGAEAPYLALWDGNSWHTIPGLDGPVYALTVHNGDLIAGGRFTLADTVTACQIARWDGASWHALRGGFLIDPPPPSVSVLAVHEGDLIAGGYFASADLTPASSVAGWNGIEWVALGSGTNEEVLALASYGGLVAGGRFEIAGSLPAGHIARWDGAAWNPLASGIGPALSSVHALVVHGGALYVGGSFETAGTRPSRNIARWKD